MVINRSIRMSGALGALRRSLTQAPKMARGIKTGQTVKGGHHDVSISFYQKHPSNNSLTATPYRAV